MGLLVCTYVFIIISSGIRQEERERGRVAGKHVLVLVYVVLTRREMGTGRVLDFASVQNTTARLNDSKSRSR